MIYLPFFLDQLIDSAPLRDARYDPLANHSV
jgi:hypothetical protein